jgi:hypothetical protein
MKLNTWFSTKEKDLIFVYGKDPREDLDVWLILGRPLGNPYWTKDDLTIEEIRELKFKKMHKPSRDIFHSLIRSIL